MLLGSDLTPYLALVLVGFLPSEVWRWLGVFLGRGIDETSAVFRWVRAVATATLAAVVAKLAFFPLGALGAIPLDLRAGAIAGGLVAFFLFRRSVLAGVLAGEIILTGGAFLLGTLRP